MPAPDSSLLTGFRSLGMCAGLIHDVPSCEELAKTLEKDAEAAFDKTSSMRVSRARL